MLEEKSYKQNDSGKFVGDHKRTSGGIMIVVIVASEIVYVRLSTDNCKESQLPVHHIHSAKRNPLAILC
jgi:hypothetical protein